MKYSIKLVSAISVAFSGFLLAQTPASNNPAIGQTPPPANTPAMGVTSPTTLPTSRPFIGRAPRNAELSTMLGWIVQPDPIEKPAKYNPAVRVNVPVKNRFVACTLTHPGASFLAIGDTSMKEETWTVVNLQTGNTAPAQKIPHNLDKHCISPDGTLLAGTGKTAQGAGIMVWSFKTGKLVQTIQSGDKNFAQELVGFANPDVLMYVDKKGFEKKLVFMSIKTGQAIGESEKISHSVSRDQIAYSANGKYVAFGDGKKLHVYDTSNGQTAGSISLESDRQKFDGDVKAVAFSPDGLEIALLAEDWGKHKIVSVDTATGKVVSTIPVSNPKGAEYQARWEQNKPVFEVLPDNGGYRINRTLIDSVTGKVVYDLKDAGVETEYPYLRITDPSTLIACSPHQNGRVMMLAAKLPRNEIDKAYAMVRQGGETIDLNLPRITPSDSTGLREVTLTPPDEWKYVPDAVANYKSLSFKSAVMKTRSNQNLKNDLPKWHLEKIAFSGAPANLGLGLYHQLRAGRNGWNKADDAIKTVVERYDLNGSGSPATFDIPTGSRLLDISADGKLVLLQIQDRLDLYSMTPGQTAPLKHLCGWRPFDDSEKKTASHQPGLYLLTGSFLMKMGAN